MTVVNFLCRMENLIMKKKIKVAVAVSVAIISLMLIPLYKQGVQEPTAPDTSPASASLRLGRDKTPIIREQSPCGRRNRRNQHSKPTADQHSHRKQF